MNKMRGHPKIITRGDKQFCSFVRRVKGLRPNKYFWVEISMLGFGFTPRLELERAFIPFKDISILSAQLSQRVQLVHRRRLRSTADLLLDSLHFFYNDFQRFSQLSNRIRTLHLSTPKSHAAQHQLYCQPYDQHEPQQNNKTSDKKVPELTTIKIPLSIFITLHADHGR
jgi:hypothetical protein